MPGSTNTCIFQQMPVTIFCPRWEFTDAMGRLCALISAILCKELEHRSLVSAGGPGTNNPLRLPGIYVLGGIKR